MHGIIAASISPAGIVLVTYLENDGSLNTFSFTPKRVKPGEPHIPLDSDWAFHKGHQRTPDEQYYELEKCIWCHPEEHGDTPGWRMVLGK